MSADRVRFFYGVTKELTKLGCKKIKQLDEYTSLWVVTKTNTAFSVPLFEDGDKCPEAMWPNVLAAVADATTENPAS